MTHYQPTAWFPVLPMLAPRVGGGGDWMQAPTEQEKAQGFKKTDVMTLQMQVSALRVAVDELVDSADVGATDPGALAALKALQSNVTGLESSVNALAQGLRWDYPLLLNTYKQLAAEFASYGVEEAAPPPVPTKGGPPVVQAPKPIKPAAPGKPTIATKPKGSDWILGVSGVVAAIGVAYGLHLAGVW